MNEVSGVAAAAEVVSLDSSVLFNIPRNRDAKTGKGSVDHLKDPELLDFYVSMCELVKVGTLTFPERVLKEAQNGPYQDLARAFTGKSWLMLERDIRVPSDAHLKTVINSDIAVLAGWGAQSETADPHVIALAMTLGEHLGKPCAVATRDREMIQFCESHGIEVIGTKAFVEFVQSRT